MSKEGSKEILNALGSDDGLKKRIKRIPSKCNTKHMQHILLCNLIIVDS